jgi:hypothetical protein
MSFSKSFCYDDGTLTERLLPLPSFLPSCTVSSFESSPSLFPTPTFSLRFVSVMFYFLNQGYQMFQNLLLIFLNFTPQLFAYTAYYFKVHAKVIKN